MPDSLSAFVQDSGLVHSAAQHPAFQHQFDTMDQQRDAATLGMWVFLITEILFFGGLFTVYLVYRSRFFEAFKAGSNSLDITLGGVNTAVLIGSSLTMVLAVYGAQTGKRQMLAGFLVLTILLGSVFLGIKAVEYAHKFEERHVPGPSFQFRGAREQLGEQHTGAATELHGDDPAHVQLFFSLYFAMTGMHALHMVIGVGLLSFLLWRAAHGAYSPEYYTPVENVGLYWHFVDIVWIFLFPLLYLISRHVEAAP